MDFKGVRALVIDVDGVLTDGSLYYTESGETIKKFNIKDGTGIRLLLLAGIEVGVITGKDSAALDYRFQELGIKYVYKNVRLKDEAIKDFAAKTGVPLKEICFIGDDVIDIKALELVGFPVAVRDCDENIKGYVKHTTQNPGGAGAVREIANKVLKDNDLWSLALKRYFEG